MRISEASVRSQASLMMSRGFLKSTPKQRRLFEYLLEESLAGRGMSLLQETIAGDLLGIKRGSGSNVVRVMAGRLRASLHGYYAGSGMNDPVVIVMPTGRYAFEFKEPGEYRAGAHVSRPIGNKPSVAVLEFRGIGLKSPWTSFTALLAEELSTLLVGLADLRIIGPLYRNELKHRAMDPVRFTQHHLGAAFIIDGSIASTDQGLVLRVRLIDGADLGQIWAKRYGLSDDAGGIADLESDLVRELAHEVGALFGVCNRHLALMAGGKPRELSVFESVLTARLFFDDFSLDSYLRGVKTLREAIRKSPFDPLPRASLSMLHVAAWNERFSVDAELPEEIDREAHLAYDLEPRNSQSLLARLCAAAIHRREQEVGKLAAAIAADPLSTKINLGTVGTWLIYLKIDLSLGRRLISRAMENNPHYPRFWHLTLSIASLAEGHDERALEEISGFLPQSYWAVHMVRAVATARRGEPRKARSEWRRLLRLFPDFPSRGHRHCGRSWHREHADMIAGSLRDCGLPVDYPDEPEQSAALPVKPRTRKTP